LVLRDRATNVELSYDCSVISPRSLATSPAERTLIRGYARSIGFDGNGVASYELLEDLLEAEANEDCERFALISAGARLRPETEEA
jgi:hypothetical protein